MQNINATKSKPKEPRLSVRLTLGEDAQINRLKEQTDIPDNSSLVKRFISAASKRTPAEVRDFLFGTGTAIVQSGNMIPILGSVSAGFGMQVIPFEEPVMARISGHIEPNWYGLLNSGSSMNGGDDPLSDGDILAFEPAIDAPNGAVVHAEWLELTTNECYCTVKRFNRDAKGRVTLSPANPDGYEPIVFDPEEQQVEEFQIKGILRRHFKP